MRVFIGWSGDRSKEVAEALHDFLPVTIQAIEPWMSELDIPKGSDWRDKLKSNLEEARAGIICITPENVSKPYILFETGFLFGIRDRLVCPYLLGLSKQDVPSPLGDLQLTLANKNETLQLMKDINDIGEKPLIKAGVLEKTFEKSWDDLDGSLKEIASRVVRKETRREPHDILEEILTKVRVISEAPPVIPRVQLEPPSRSIIRSLLDLHREGVRSKQAEIVNATIHLRGLMAANDDFELLERKAASDGVKELDRLLENKATDSLP